MVAEAQAVRERVLRDLATRRKKARQQIEQLNAGRERLLQAYDVVRNTVEEATTELSASVGDARLAAAAAARRVEAEPEATVEQLDEELTTARIVHLPIAEPVPFVRIPAGRQAREEAALAERTVSEATPEPAGAVIDEPAVEAPAVEAPVAEAPVAEAPAVEERPPPRRSTPAPSWPTGPRPVPSTRSPRAVASRPAPVAEAVEPVTGTCART